MHRRLTATLATAGVLFLSAPALADHGIAGGGVSGSGPVVTLEAQTLPQGRLAGGLSFRLAVPDGYDDASLIALAAQHVHAHTTDYNLGVTAALAYGVTDRFMLSAALPYVRRERLREGEHSHSGGIVSNTVEQLGTVSGIGDLSLIGQYAIAGDHEQAWSVALLGGIKVPTGSTHETDQAGERLETEHQPGTGSWDPLVGLAASKSWGRWSAHASALYQKSTTGAQDTRLGDRMNFAAAIVYNLTGGNEHHEHHDDGEAHEHPDPSSWAVMIEPSYEYERRQTIAGAVEEDRGAKMLWLSPGLRFSSSAGWSAAVSAGLPLWQDVGASHPRNGFRAIAQVGTSF